MGDQDVFVRPFVFFVAFCSKKGIEQKATKNTKEEAGRKERRFKTAIIVGVSFGIQFS